MGVGAARRSLRKSKNTTRISDVVGFCHNYHLLCGVSPIAYFFSRMLLKVVPKRYVALCPCEIDWS
jgi:hypothetical protein